MRQMIYCYDYSAISGFSAAQSIQEVIYLKPASSKHLIIIYVKEFVLTMLPFSAGKEILKAEILGW